MLCFTMTLCAHIALHAQCLYFFFAQKLVFYYPINHSDNLLLVEHTKYILDSLWPCQCLTITTQLGVDSDESIQLCMSHAPFFSYLLI